MYMKYGCPQAYTYMYLVNKHMHVYTCFTTLCIQMHVHILYMYMILSKLPWLHTAIYHTGLDVKNESHMYVPLAEGCVGSARSADTLCHVR